MLAVRGGGCVRLYAVLAVLAVATVVGKEELLCCAYPPPFPPTMIDVALKKFYDQCNGRAWPRPWGDHWGNEQSCAWDNDEKKHPAPLGARCVNGGWLALPPKGMGGLVYLEHYSRAAKGPIPAEFKAFQATQFIGLWNNMLTGPIWDTAHHGMLMKLDVSENQFSGAVPRDFLQKNRFGDLVNLGNNSFSGALPPLTQMPYLQAAMFGANQFSGAVPPEYTQLRQLRHLDLHSNRLSGPVPTLSPMENLAWLDLSGNDLTGSLPELPSNVTRVELANNRFHGPIPASYGSLPRLRHFDCRNCGDVTCPTPDLLAHVPFSTHCKPGNARAWPQPSV